MYENLIFVKLKLNDILLTYYIHNHSITVLRTLQNHVSIIYYTLCTYNYVLYKINNITRHEPLVYYNDIISLR